MNRAEHIARAEQLLAQADVIVNVFHRPDALRPEYRWEGGGSALGETAQMLAGVAAAHVQLAALKG